MSEKAALAKKTVYVDVDEEITGIIDKIRSPKESIIALVLPKRATMLHSAVNMKLLKRSADQGGKKVVLITSESTLMALAGAAGIHVAANLQSRPYLPAGPAAQSAKSEPEPVESSDSDSIDKNASVGSLLDKKKDSSDPIEIDNTPKEEDLEAASAATKASNKKPKKDRSKAIPNFSKFRKLLFVGIAALILLIGFGYWALAIAPKSTVTLRTESSETLAEAQFSADTTVDTLDLADKVLPAEQRDLKKTESEKVPATGEKDNGTKASGKVSLRNCTDNEITIPAGTGVSSGDLTFITQNAIKLDEGEFSSQNSGGQCKTNGDHTGSINVVAKENGDKYNVAARPFNVSGFSGVVAQGDQMSGGTSKISKVVAQADVDAAKKKITDKQNAVVQEIKDNLKKDGYIGIVDSFSAGTPALNPSPAVGTEAADVTVSGDITYSMLGVKEADLKKLVEEQSKGKIDTSKQSILNYGFDDATFEVGAKRKTSTDIKLKTTLLAGPEINQPALKKELAGKKRGDAESQLKSRPGITEAKVEYSPFWVSKIPGKESKVTFVIEQADGTKIDQ